MPSCPDGCLDTCLGPHKRWSKKGPKIGRFEGGRSRGLEGRYPKVVPKIDPLISWSWEVLPRPTNMSERLTDQGPYTRGSCNVMMGT